MTKNIFILLLCFLPFLPCLAQQNDSTQTKQKKRNIIIRFDDWLQKFDAKDTEKRPTAMFVNPAMNFSPSTSLGLGAYFVIKVDNTKVRDSKWDKFNTNSSFFDAQVMYTLNNQLSVTAAPNWFFINNRLNIEGRAGYSNSSDFFWGIGDDTPNSNRDKYSYQSWQFDFNAQWEFFPKFFAGAAYTFKHYSISDYAQGGTIDTGNYLGKDKTFISGIGLLADYDSRDDIYAARKGHYFSVRGDVFNKALGSTHDFSKLTIDLRSYFTIAENHLIAGQIFMQEVYGEIPFFEYPSLANSSYVRGILVGRYKDKAVVSTQLEYRYYFGRFAAVAFGGLSNVGNDLLKAWSISKWNAGMGIRFRVFKKSKLYMRLDIATGPQGKICTYFTVNELF